MWGSTRWSRRRGSATTSRTSRSSSTSGSSSDRRVLLKRSETRREADLLLIAIPARYRSRRLPGKPLVDLEGRTLIQHVAARMLEVPGAEVVVVTDDRRIARSAALVGAPAYVSTRPAASGSDRIRHYFDDTDRAWPEIVVNAQGDEPLVPARAVIDLLRSLADPESAPVATLLRALDPDEAGDPNVVKAALLPTGMVETFARLPSEDLRPAGSEDDLDCPRRHRWLAHVGVYAFRAPAFRLFTDLPRSLGERRERLEQLRLLDGRIPIRGLAIPERPIAVDTAADAERVREILRERAPAVAHR